MLRSNTLRLAIGLMAVTTAAAAVVGDDAVCSSNSYRPADTAEQCFPLVADPEIAWETDAGTACISVTGSVMSVRFATISYWSVFNSQIFVGTSIGDIPRASDGTIDVTSFNAVSEEYRGSQDETIQVDLADFPMDTAQCEQGLVIMAHSKLAEICQDPVAQGEPLVNWTRFTDVSGTAGPDEIEGYDFLRMFINCQCEEPPPVPRLAPPRDPEPEPTPDVRSGPTPSPKGSGSGDPHFKTWTGEKYDYHGECDLVLVDNPAFANGLGLRVHIRTTAIKYFSFIEKIAVQIGTDVLEFENHVDNFLINGAKVEENRKYHKTYLGGYLVRRDKKAISVRLEKEGKAKIELHTRKNGFPSVIVDGGSNDIFKGSLGLLGDWETGKRFARDGKTELDGHDATAFALEWQVSDKEPMLFADARFPQFPATCTPPAKMAKNRLGSSFDMEAEEACAHWKEDKEDCIFDVIATRDVLVAAEGHLVNVE